MRSTSESRARSIERTDYTRFLHRLLTSGCHLLIVSILDAILVCSGLISVVFAVRGSIARTIRGFTCRSPWISTTFSFVRGYFWLISLFGRGSGVGGSSFEIDRVELSPSPDLASSVLRGRARPFCEPWGLQVQHCLAHQSTPVPNGASLATLGGPLGPVSPFLSHSMSDLLAKPKVSECE